MTLFRPAVVSEYQRTRVASTRYKWQVYKIATYVVTAGIAGVLIFGQDYVGNGRGDHALSGVQAGARRVYEAIMLSGSHTVPAQRQQALPAPVTSIEARTAATGAPSDRSGSQLR
jgi:hypothetical protein